MRTDSRVTLDGASVMWYRTMTSLLRLLVLLAALPLSLAACDSDADGDGGQEPENTGCIISTRLLHESVAIDAIPALTDPELVGAEEVDYLTDDALVLGFRLGDLTVAVPHNLLNWHEVINFNQTNPRVAITFCPLTGSGLAFDRAAIGDAEFGVSGLIFLNNNVLYDRRSPPSLWSQMSTKAICGQASRMTLRPVALLEMTWAGWRSLYPDTRVLSTNTGFDRNYRIDPIAEYKEVDNARLLFPMPGPIDTRRPPKERVLGIPDGLGGLAFPFLALDNGEPFRVIHTAVAEQPLVVFFDRTRNAAAAYHLIDEHAQRTFEVRDGQIVDAETESVWQVDGRATSGPLEGSRLAPIDEAYVSFWFAWAVFQPETEIWIDES